MPEKKTEKSLKSHTVAQRKYDQKNTIHIGIGLNTRTDAPILAKLYQVPSMSGYIRSVLFDDIRRNSPELMEITQFVKDKDSISFGRTSPNPSETLIIPTSTSPSNPRKKRKPDPET